MTIPLWIAFLLFCVGAVAGWLVHVEYLAFKKEEEEIKEETDQEWLNRMKREAMKGQAERNKELIKRIMEGRII